MEKFFENKIILITGGTGSFGSTVLSRLLQTNIKEIFIIFCNDGFVLLMLIYQINILYKIDLYFFFIFWFFYYFFGITKYLLKK